VPLDVALRWLVDDGGEHEARVLVVEWRLAHQHLVQHDAERPPVARVAVRVVAAAAAAAAVAQLLRALVGGGGRDHLGRHVHARADEGARAGVGAAQHVALAEAEVHEAHVAAVVEHDVGGLEVSVGDVQRVQVRDGAGHLRAVEARALHAQPAEGVVQRVGGGQTARRRRRRRRRRRLLPLAARAAQVVEEVAGLQVLHAEVEPLGALEGELERGDERVRHLRHDLPLLRRVLLGVRGHLLLGEDLHGEVTLGVAQRAVPPRGRPWPARRLARRRRPPRTVAALRQHHGAEGALSEQPQHAEVFHGECLLGEGRRVAAAAALVFAVRPPAPAKTARTAAAAAAASASAAAAAATRRGPALRVLRPLRLRL